MSAETVGADPEQHRVRPRSITNLALHLQAMRYSLGIISQLEDS